jgi:hypothetical protein
MKLLIVDLLISILNLKQGLSVCNGELGDHCTCVKKRPVHRDVVAVLLQDALIFKVPVRHFMARPCHTLHPKVLRQVVVIVGALNLIGMLHVAVVGLDVFAWLQTVQ